MVSKGWGRGVGESLFNDHRVSILQDEKSSGDGGWRWLHNNVNVLSATELDT